MKRLIGVLLGLAAFAAVSGGDAEPPARFRPTINQAALANNDFAFDLYGQLAREKSGKSLFFSPYSISNALVLVAEGARGKTADEMGKALRFPPATRRTGDDAGELPWNSSQAAPRRPVGPQQAVRQSQPPSAEGNPRGQAFVACGRN